MKKIFMVISTLLLIFQVGCNNDNNNNNNNNNKNNNNTNSALNATKTSYWLHKQSDDLADIKEDILEAYEDDTFTEEEKRHIQRELTKINRKLTDKDVGNYGTQEEINQLKAAYGELVKLINDGAATKASIETAIKDVEKKYVDVFKRAEDDLDDEAIDTTLWMNDFAYDAYDLVEEGREYIAGTEGQLALKEDIDELKAEWAMETLKANITDKEKATHKEIMDIITNLQNDLDKDTAVVKEHIDKLEAKLKADFNTLYFEDED